MSIFVASISTFVGSRALNAVHYYGKLHCDDESVLAALSDEQCQSDGSVEAERTLDAADAAKLTRQDKLGWTQHVWEAGDVTGRFDYEHDALATVVKMWLPYKNPENLLFIHRGTFHYTLLSPWDHLVQGDPVVKTRIDQIEEAWKILGGWDNHTGSPKRKEAEKYYEEWKSLIKPYTTPNTETEFL